MYKFAMELLNSGNMQQVVNKTLLVLVPKVIWPKNFMQFRPISLCSVIYKMLTKTLVNILKIILPKVLGPNQDSFILGRQITNNMVVV